jgi:N,N'-diacetyllegionaminate synthase
MYNKETFIIAEIAQAHEGSLGIAHSYIDALAKTGVNAVKFQTHIADAESSEYENFRINFSYEDYTRFDYWKRMEFTIEQWDGLKKHCDDLDLEFISSPFSCAAVDVLEKIGVDKYKIGSGETTNYLMLQKIAETGKDILLSSGMSSFSEIDETLNFLKPFKNKISVFQCTTEYPTSPETWGLNVISEMKSKYQLPIGFSDHSSDIYAPMAAVTLGVELLEFHAVFHKDIFGPDAKASLNMEQIKQLVIGVRDIEKSINNPVDKNDNLKYESNKILFGKSLAINKNLESGHILQIEDLESKKPAEKGIPASEFQSIIGRKLNKSLKKWEFITINDIQ